MIRPNSDFQGTETFSDLQQEMLNGECPAGCRRCWEDEHNGLFSYRSNYGDDPSQRESIRYLDLRNNNTCNLSCRICSPSFSSTWTKLVGDLEFERFDVWPMLENITEGDLKEIYFTGGEPMLNPDHWKLLDRLIANGHSQNINLRYNTNLSTSVYQGRSVTDLWKKFKHISIYASLEAIGEPAEYIRSGLSWTKAESTIENFLKFREQHQTIDISVFCTVGLLNIWFLQDLVDWCHQRNMALNLSVLEGPDFLSLASLPDELKHIIPKITLSHDNYFNANLKILEIATSRAGETQHLFLHTIAHILMMDKLRGDHMFDLLPKELQNFAKRKVLLV
jgi:molybdenum cofactor biosynthesis enzyme MoaA